MRRVYGGFAALHGHPARRTIRSVRYRESLPQLSGNVLLTDGGMETTLIFGTGEDAVHYETIEGDTVAFVATLLRQPDEAVAAAAGLPT